MVNIAFANADATEEQVIACDLNPDCVTPGAKTILFSID